MRQLIGALMMLAGVAFGLYAGLWWAFIGGIVQFIEAIRATEIVGLTIALAVAKFLFSGVIGMVSGAIAALPGYLLVHWGRKGMSCQSCKHFGALQSICRRHPPVAQCVGIQQNGTVQGQPLVVTFWPSVQKNEVCGEFEADLTIAN